MVILSLFVLFPGIVYQPDRKCSSKPVAIIQHHLSQRTLSKDMHHHTVFRQAGPEVGIGIGMMDTVTFASPRSFHRRVNFPSRVASEGAFTITRVALPFGKT